MPEENTTTTTTSGSSWKKTASVVAIAVAGLLLVVGNFLGGTLDLSDALVKGFDALAAVLGAFGIGTFKKTATGA